VERRGTSVESVLFRKEKRSCEWWKRQRMWPCHKKHSKKSRGEVQHMFYDEKHRNTVERVFQMRHAC